MKKTMLALSAVALAAVMGCNSETVKTTALGGKTLNLTAPKEVDVRVSDDPTKFSVSIERGGFEDDVSIEISGLPSGIELVEKSTTIAKGIKEASYHLRAGEGAKVAESQTFKVTAKGGGATVSKDVRLDVAAKKGDTKPAVGGDPAKPSPEVQARKEKLRNETKAKLDANAAAIKSLEDAQKTAQADAKPEIDKDLADLRKRHADLQLQMDKIDTTKSDAWDEFSAGVGKAADDMNAAMKRAMDRIKK